MMLDHGSEIFLWVGAGADAVESRNAYCSAMNFLKVNGKPTHTPIHLYNEGKPITSEIWNAVFKDGPSAKLAAPAAPPPSVVAAAAAAPEPKHVASVAEAGTFSLAISKPLTCGMQRALTQQTAKSTLAMQISKPHWG